MALEKQTQIDCIEIYPQTGQTFVRLSKQVVDGDTVLFSEPHRAPIQGGDMAEVNSHLARIGFPAVSKAQSDILDTVRAGALEAMPDRIDRLKAE